MVLLPQNWFLLSVDVETVDTTKPHIGRRKHLLSLTASKENTGDLSQSSITLNSKTEEVFCFFLNKFFYLFIIYFWLRWVFLVAHGLSLVAAGGGYSSLRCAGFSLQWFLLLRSTGSRRAGFSSCGARAQLVCGMWDLPGPGLKPVSPALAGGFLTTAPPGKPYF